MSRSKGGGKGGRGGGGGGSESLPEPLWDLNGVDMRLATTNDVVGGMIGPKGINVNAARKYANVKVFREETNEGDRIIDVSTANFQGGDLCQVIQNLSQGFPGRGEFYVKVVVEQDAYEALMCAGIEDVLRHNLDTRDNERGSIFSPAAVLRVQGEHQPVLQCLLTVVKALTDFKNGATPGELEIQEPDLSAPGGRQGAGQSFRNKRGRDDDAGGHSSRRRLDGPAKVDDLTRAKQLVTACLQKLREVLRTDKSVNLKPDQIKGFNMGMIEPIKEALQMQKDGAEESTINDHLATTCGEALITCEADPAAETGDFNWSISTAQELADLCVEKMFRPTVSPYSDRDRGNNGISRDYSRDGGRNDSYGGRGGGGGGGRGMAPMAFPGSMGSGGGRGGGGHGPRIPQGRFDMVITNDQAGSILRDKGAFINHVRKRSHATVKVANVSNHDDMREVYIEGSTGEVAEALHMLDDHFRNEDY